MTARLRGDPGAVRGDAGERREPAAASSPTSAIAWPSGSVGFFKGDVPTWAKTAAGNDTAAARRVRGRQRPGRSTALRGGGEVARRPICCRARRASTPSAPRPSPTSSSTRRCSTSRSTGCSRSARRTSTRTTRTFVATAKKIDPKQDADGGAGDARRRPPEGGRPDRRRPHATIEATRKFLIDKKIVDVPSEVRPTIAETPPFARTGGFASMDTPGAYETKATEAFYYVTPPEKDWDAKHKEEHMRLFNRPVMRHHHHPRGVPRPLPAVPLRQAVPDEGAEAAHLRHERRGLGALRRADDRGARATATATRRCGWPSSSEALLRDCRYVVGIKLHTAGHGRWRTGEEVLRREGLHEPADGLPGGAPRHVQPDVPVLHARQAPDLQAARGLPEGEGRGLLAAAVPRRVRAAGRRCRSS